LSEPFQVKVESVELHPFRNFDRAAFSMPAERVLISGRNGRGKSNVLEAIAFLSIGKSVRGARDQQAVPFSDSHFDISATCMRGGRPLRLRLYYSRTEGKQAFVDGDALDGVSQLLGRLRTVHFAPEDVALVLRFPAQRRRLLDVLLSQSSPAYLRHLQRYQRVLAQRNALLRDALQQDAASLATWTEQLALAGGEVRRLRLQALALLRNPFAAAAARLAPSAEHLDFAYRGAADAETDQAEALRLHLERSATRERQLGHTLVGPHRDDLVFLADGRAADEYASEGQLKTLLIAWKLAEVAFLEDQAGGQPVLLLDDVLSELDEARSSALLEMMDGFEQVVLTSPRPLAPGSVRGFLDLCLDP